MATTTIGSFRRRAALAAFPMARILAVVVGALILGMAVSPGPSVAHEGTGSAHFDIDMRPYNGTAPCFPVDTNVTVELGDTFEAALCIGDTQASSVLGDMVSYVGTLAHGSEIIAPNVASDLTFDLNSNPNWNEGADLGGTDWDCNLLNILNSAPQGNPSPTITCRTNDLAANVLPGSSTHVATVDFTATSLGTTSLTWSTSGFNPSGLVNSVTEYLCVFDMTCNGGSVNVVSPNGELDGFHRSFYTVLTPPPNFVCGALVDETAGALSGSIDCTTAYAGNLIGTITTATHPDTVSGDIYYPSGSIVHFDGYLEVDNTGAGSWNCTAVCTTNGVYTSEKIAPVGPQCANIGPAGGMLTLLPHGDTLTFAAGTLPFMTPICGEMVNLPLVVGPGSNIITRAYRFTPHGLAFAPAQLAQLELRYQQAEVVAGMTESNLGVYVYDGLQGRWRVQGSGVDTTNNVVTVMLPHFSEYTVLDCGTGPDTDSALSNGPGIDTTVPNGDGVRDLCDLDDDGDGLPDEHELTGMMCSGKITEVSTDIAYSDGDPTGFDTDGDGVLDGAECARGTDPTNAANKPTAASCRDGALAGADSDFDGLFDEWENCKWGSSKNNKNTEEDKGGDCVEAMDVNGNGVLTNADATLVKQSVFAIIVGDGAAMDINGNGAVTNADATFILQAVFLVNPCL